jgi:radical SAM superfamily enzyme YgiQ (UPF0313 family)
MKVGLVQINNSFSGQSYLPYSAGLIQSYLLTYSKYAKDLVFKSPIYSRIKVDDSVERLLDSDIVLFSMYVWNARISLEIAEKLKARKPSIKIIFGGPQVPDRAEEFILKHRFIDFCVHSEGETVIHQLIDSDFSKDISGTSYVENGVAIVIPKGPRIKDLNSIPSPFLTGAFDQLMAENPDQKWIACWETDRGCPFSCTFCDWGSNTMGKVSQFAIDRILKEVDWFAEKKIDYVFCCNANFGILPRDIEIAEYIAKVKVATGFPQRLSVQNTKNATDRSYRVQKILSDFGLNKGVTLSMQSVDQQTLVNIKRSNISLESYQELQRRFTKDKVETYTDLILGLPGETYESLVNGIDTIINNGQHNRIQFNNLGILPNSEMAKPEYMEKFGLKTVESSIINMHGSLGDQEYEILERQQLVISTNSLPPEDWVKTRSVCWLVNFLYFNKVFQIPIILAHKLGGLSYKQVFESFMSRPLDKYPILASIKTFFNEKAKNIQNGGEEYELSKEFLNVYWPADELMLIYLVFENKIDQFYIEMASFLKSIMGIEYKDIFIIIDEAVKLNRSLLKMPYQTTNLEFDVKFNILEYFRAIVIGEEIPLEALMDKKMIIDRTSQTWNTPDDYCREVIWYGNKMGAYLYGNAIYDERLAGIH